MNVKDYFTLHFDINISNETAVVHFTVTVRSSTISVKRTLTYMYAKATGNFVNMSFENDLRRAQVDITIASSKDVCFLYKFS
jgi:hypothetical protein